MAVDHGGSRPAAPYALCLRPTLSAEEILRSPDRGRGLSRKHLMLLINSLAQMAPAVIPESRAGIAQIWHGVPNEVND
jgi:hypothetical protein